MISDWSNQETYVRESRRIVSSNLINVLMGKYLQRHTFISITETNFIGKTFKTLLEIIKMNKN